MVELIGRKKISFFEQQSMYELCYWIVILFLFLFTFFFSIIWQPTLEMCCLFNGCYILNDLFYSLLINSIKSINVQYKNFHNSIIRPVGIDTANTGHIE